MLACVQRMSEKERAREIQMRDADKLRSLSSGYTDRQSLHKRHRNIIIMTSPGATLQMSVYSQLTTPRAFTRKCL